MKTKILFLGLVGAVVTCVYLFPSPRCWIVSGGLWVLMLGLFFSHRRSSCDVVCRILGLTWSRSAFCRGWLITGSTGSGKTLSGLRTLLFEVFKNQPNFGGLCIDDKGTLSETILEMADHFGRANDVIVLRVGEEPGNELPANRFNLIGDQSIPSATYARCVIDTATAHGNRNEQSFFKSAAQIHIAQGQIALAALDFEVTLENVYNLLTDVNELKEVVSALESRPAAAEIARHFQKFLAQPPEQLAGVTGSITNYLHHYATNPAIAEVFCRDNTFELGDVDKGKIICLALPQKYQTERRYIGTFLKQLFFLHALRRFDLSSAERDQRNLLLFLADEAQHFLTMSEDGLSDHSVVDVVREAGVAFVASTQSSTSLVPVLSADIAKVLALNLRNRMIFTGADEDDARASAEFIGKCWKNEYSETTGAGSRSRTRHRREGYRLEPDTLRKLPNHECVLIHVEKGYRRGIIPPIEPNGKICRWFRRWS